MLVDEVLTPDSSRFWPKDGYTPGGPQPSFDKQFLRDYLLVHQVAAEAAAAALARRDRGQDAGEVPGGLREAPRPPSAVRVAPADRSEHY